MLWSYFCESVGCQSWWLILVLFRGGVVRGALLQWGSGCVYSPKSALSPTERRRPTSHQRQISLAWFATPRLKPLLSLPRGGNAGPCWTNTKHCHYCWNFAFLYPVLLFLSLVPNNDQGLQEETFYTRGCRHQYNPVPAVGRLEQKSL